MDPRLKKMSDTKVAYDNAQKAYEDAANDPRMFQPNPPINDLTPLAVKLAICKAEYDAAKAECDAAQLNDSVNE